MCVSWCVMIKYKRRPWNGLRGRWEKKVYLWCCLSWDLQLVMIGHQMANQFDARISQIELANI